MAYRNGGGAVIDRAVTDDWTAATAAPSIVPALPHDRHAAAPARPPPVRPKLPRCPEIDCVRHLLAPGVLALAELRAAETGAGADRVLITAGDISEETYVAALAASLDIAFEPLNDRSRDDCPISDDRLIEAATTGLLPLVDGNEVNIVVAPRLVDSRRLLSVANSNSEFAQRMRFTSAARLQDFVAATPPASSRAGQLKTCARTIRNSRPAPVTPACGRSRSWPVRSHWPCSPLPAPP